LTLIVNIKRNSLDDGPGIRTIIFFKGCPLSCVWCQNPETKLASQEITFTKEDCLSCNKCLEVCDEDAIDFSDEYRIIRDFCNLCGKCIEICPNEAIKFAGKNYELNDLINLVLKDKIFYVNSGGGVTLSGGEPTFHMEYVNNLLIELKKEEIHVCLETCGYYNRDQFNNLLLPYLDLIYFDLKIYDSQLHKKYCKLSNQRILENFEDLVYNSKVELLPRIPLIPKITAQPENLIKLANYLKSHGINKIGLLPYNPIWLSKAETLGVKSEYIHDKWLTTEAKEKIKEIFSDFEFKDF